MHVNAIAVDVAVTRRAKTRERVPSRFAPLMTPRVAIPDPTEQTGAMGFTMKRVYEPPDASDGYRVLVDRLWPRGVRKERAQLDEWAKDAAPSPALRTEWHHNRERFDEFAARYRDELDANPAAKALLEAGRDHDRVTLLFGARDEQVNHAAVLLAWLGDHGASVES